MAVRSVSIGSVGVAPGPSELHQQLALTFDRTPMLCIEGSLQEWEAAASSAQTLRQLCAVTIGICVNDAAPKACPVPVALKACDLRVLIAGERSGDNAWNRVFATGAGARAWASHLERSLAGRGPAALTCARTLRLSAEVSELDGLVLESLAYSLLQAGPDHQRWLSQQRGS